MLLLDELEEIIHDALVKVFTTQVSITVGGQHFEDALVDSKDGDIKGSATKIVDQDVAFLALLVKTIGNGNSSRLVDIRRTLRPAIVPASLVA